MPDPTAGRWPAAPRLLASQFSYHLVLMARSPRAVFAGVLLPAIILAMRGSSAADHAGQGADLVAGLAVLGAVSASYVTHATSLVLARDSGVLRRWRLSPLPPWCYFAGKTLATLVLATGCALSTVAVAALLGISSSAGHVALMIAPITLGVVCWATVATAVSSLVPGGGTAYPLLTLTYLPVVLLSGAVGRPADQPAWLRTVTDLFPVRPILAGVADALKSGHLDMTLSAAVVLVGWTGASAFAAAASFRWAPRTMRSSPTRRRHG
jgi:ABC-2 type transport system permease protein